MSEPSGAYYFCLKHHTVEGVDGCRAKDRLGPYETADQAARALEIAQERNEAWDEDPRWNDPDDPAAPGEPQADR